MTDLSADLALADSEARASRERVRFEAWMFEELSRVISQDYGDPRVCAAWDGWQARAALAPAVPPGFVLVPVEPTPDMVAAIPYPLSVTPNTGIQCYRAMCAAAPSAKEPRIE